MSGANSVDFDYILGNDSLASQVTGMWEMWKNAKSEWMNRVAENTKYVMATSTVETTNVQNPHSHTTHIPKMAQVFDNLVANYMDAMFPNEDWLKFEGNDPESQTFDKRKAVLAYITTKHKLNKFESRIQELVQDWVLTGNAFARVGYRNEFHQDPDTGETYLGYVGPYIERISPYDIVFNPLATDFEHSPKIIRSLKTLGELSRDAEENPDLAYSQEVINKVTQSRNELKNYSDTAIDKYMQLMYDGFSSPSVYYNSGFCEILEFYGDIYDTNSGAWLKNHVITVVDRRWVLRSQPLNTWSGRPHIYHVGWRTRPDNLWAMGPLDNLVGMQYIINHLENARADAFDQMIDPDRVIVGDVEIERRGAAIDFYVVEGGAVNYLAPDTTVLNADFQIQRKTQEMEEYAGAPREAMGIRTPGEKTAFEVSSLQNAAGRIFQNKVNYFEKNFIEPIVNAEIEQARKNIGTVDLVKIVDDDIGVTEFLKITKEDLSANGTLIPIGARHYARQSILVQNLNQFMQALQLDQMMAQHFPSERLAKAWEDLLGFQRLELFEKYGRIGEQLEMAKLQQLAQQDQEVTAGIPLEEPLEEPQPEEGIPIQ